ncbi:MAG: late competence development ComFB family protein [Gemmatimonadaceae bacterium]
MKNRLEEMVRQVYAEMREQHPEFCHCAVCEDDVVAYVLNHSRPRYSGGTPTGTALISLDLQGDQTRATVAVLMLEGMQRVATSPRHPLPKGEGRQTD